jgi:hypothetical protein
MYLSQELWRNFVSNQSPLNRKRGREVWDPRLLVDKDESATGMGAEDTDDDGNETDEEIEVTDNDREEEFDGDAFSVLLAAGNADNLGNLGQPSNIREVLSKAAPWSTIAKGSGEWLYFVFPLRFNAW